MEEFKNKYRSKINEYLLYFFVYAFLGWVLETVFSYFVLGYFDNRGFLIGPICPIYGFGMLILIMWLSRYKDNNIKLFVISAIVLTFFEYVVGYALDAIFQLKWWDYTNDFFNINGRVCLSYALGWGIIAIIVIKYIHPFIVKLLKKIKNKARFLLEDSVLKLFFVILVMDIILSSMQYLQK